MIWQLPIKSRDFLSPGSLLDDVKQHLCIALDLSMYPRVCF